MSCVSPKHFTKVSTAKDLSSNIAKMGPKRLVKMRSILELRQENPNIKTVTNNGRWEARPMIRTKGKKHNELLKLRTMKKRTTTKKTKTKMTEAKMIPQMIPKRRNPILLHVRRVITKP